MERIMESSQILLLIKYFRKGEIMNRVGIVEMVEIVVKQKQEQIQKL